jgi:hypothetical protein
VRISRLVRVVDGGGRAPGAPPTGGRAPVALVRLVDRALVTGVLLLDRDLRAPEVGGGRLPDLLPVVALDLVRVTLVERSGLVRVPLVERSLAGVVVRLRLEERPRPFMFTLT